MYARTELTNNAPPFKFHSDSDLQNCDRSPLQVKCCINKALKCVLLHSTKTQHRQNRSFFLRGSFMGSMKSQGLWRHRSQVAKATQFCITMPPFSLLTNYTSLTRSKQQMLLKTQQISDLQAAARHYNQGACTLIPHSHSKQPKLA